MKNRQKTPLSVVLGVAAIVEVAAILITFPHSRFAGPLFLTILFIGSSVLPFLALNAIIIAFLHCIKLASRASEDKVAGVDKQF